MPSTLADAPAVTAGIPYTVDTGQKLVNETFGQNNIQRLRTGTHELRSMSVRNGRPLAGELSLDGNGFVFVEHKTRVRDFFDAEELKAVYYSEVEREARLVREPVLSAHNDYTEWSGPQRVRDILPDEAEELLRRRFAIIQVWRAINQPIQANPLAVADARSVAFEDFLLAERRYPNRVGQTYRLMHNPDHRSTFLACGATRRWCSRCSTRRRTGGSASRRTPRSRILHRRRMPHRARALRRARWSSSGPETVSRHAGQRRDSPRHVQRPSASPVAGPEGRIRGRTGAFCP